MQEKDIAREAPRKPSFSIMASGSKSTGERHGPCRLWKHLVRAPVGFQKPHQGRSNVPDRSRGRRSPSSGEHNRHLNYGGRKPVGFQSAAMSLLYPQRRGRHDKAELRAHPQPPRSRGFGLGGRAISHPLLTSLLLAPVARRSEADTRPAQSAPSVTHPDSNHHNTSF